VTKALGLSEQHGIDAELIAMNSAVAVAAMQTGELDFMAGTGSAARAALRGAPIRVVLVTSTSPDHMLLGAKDLTSVAQLRGKPIAADRSPQSNTSVILTELLRRGGLEPGQYEILNVPDGAARAAALENGLASATLLESVSALPVQMLGYPALAHAVGQVELLFTVLAASTPALQNNRAALGQTMRAVVAGVEVTRTQKATVVPIMAKQYELSLEDATAIYDLLQPGWTRDGRPTPSAVKVQIEMDQQAMELNEPIQPHQVFDVSLLDELTAR
jgi:ABC-type nitrate/sulfonate/bicarbonate transport system substrate-binding protein